MTGSDERQEPVIPDAVLAVDSEDRVARPQKRGGGETVRIAGRKKKGKAAGASGTRPGSALLLLLCLAGVLAYLFWNAREQQAREDALVMRLDAATQRINVLEGDLSATGESLSESESEVGTRVGTLEHEIRKLWDVSNKRNKQWIQDNQVSLEKLSKASGERESALSAELAALQKTLEQVRAGRSKESETAAELKAGLADLPALKKELEKATTLASELEKSTAALQKESAAGRTGLAAELKTLEQSLLSMQARSDRLGVQVTRLNAAVTKLEQELATSQGGSDLDALRKALVENEQAVRSFDAFRRQTNQSITSLQTAVSQLQNRN